MTLAFLVLPISVIYLVVKRPSKDEIEDEEGVFMQRLRPLTDEVRVNDRWQLSFYMFFVLRRTAFLLVGLLLPSTPWTNLQLLAAMYINLAFDIYFGKN